MIRQLTVTWNRQLVGFLTEKPTGDLQFRYADSWLSDSQNPALSLSLPLRPEPFSNKGCQAFFSGLLPEESQRRLVAQTLGVSEKNDFSMLEQIGGDCAGAIQFFPGNQLPEEDYSYKPLSDTELEAVLDRLPTDPLLAGEPEMRLSLAGAQSKLPVYLKDGHVFLPLNGAPSSHIIKPGNQVFPEMVQNEWFCMTLAAHLGLPVAKTEIREVNRRSVLLVERYDRQYFPSHSLLFRIHQEDFCQALGIPSQKKYQNEGGPSLKKCFELIREHSTVPASDITWFIQVIVFNVIIGNNDAHGKNFSFLFKTKSLTQLAPFYDLISTMVYPQLSKKMAMAIGREYMSSAIQLYHFEKLAEEVGISPSAMRNRVIEFAQRIAHQATLIQSESKIIQDIQKYISHKTQTLLNSTP